MGDKTAIADKPKVAAESTSMQETEVAEFYSDMPVLWRDGRGFNFNSTPLYSNGSVASIIQPKLEINQPGDKYEQEADAMADKVMRMEDVSLQAGTHDMSSIQRKCTHCEEEEKEKVQRKPLSSGVQQKTVNGSNELVSEPVSSQIESTRGNGFYMDRSTRSFMENRFDADFSGVKIHTGQYAAQLSSKLQAKAFTTGNNIYFNNGKYQPGTQEGKRLLAHELTHTIQQNAGTRKIQREFFLEEPSKKGASRQLTAAEKSTAIKFNKKFLFTKSELQYLTDLFGTESKDPDTDVLHDRIADDLVGYQTTYALTADGTFNYMTARYIMKEIQLESDYVGGTMDKAASGIIAKLAAKYSSPLLYVGMNSYVKEEKKLKSELPFADQGQLNSVKGGTKPEAVDIAGVTYDLTDDKEVEKFVTSLGIADKKKNDDITAFLKSISKSNRDEMALLIRAYNQAENSQVGLMTRMIVSGHSGGFSVFGDGLSSMIELSHFVKLKELFPKAASQVQHLMLSACSAGTQDTIEDVIIKAFPNLRTFWGYYGACPLAGGPHITQWLKETSGNDVHKLSTGGGGGVSIWNEGKYQGDKSLTKAEAISRVDSNDTVFQDYFNGVKESKDPDSGEIFEYVNSVRRLLGRDDLTAAEKTKYKARRDQANRLRFYRKIAQRFMSEQKTLLDAAYGKNTPDYGALSRKDTMQKITKFDTEATGPADKKTEAKTKLETCLRDLNPSCIPDSWLQH